MKPFLPTTCLLIATALALEAQDYASKALRFTFADSLAEQEAQLKDNPLLHQPLHAAAAEAQRRHARRHPRFAIARCSRASDEPFKLRVFIDRGIVEVFINGRQCLAIRVHPGRADSVGVSLLSPGQDAKLKSLTAWPMQGTFDSLAP